MCCVGIFLNRKKQRKMQVLLCFHLIYYYIGKYIIFSFRFFIIYCQAQKTICFIASQSKRWHLFSHFYLILHNRSAFSVFQRRYSDGLFKKSHKVHVAVISASRGYFSYCHFCCGQKMLCICHATFFYLLRKRCSEIFSV